MSRGTVATGLPSDISDPEVAQSIKSFCQATAIPAESFARGVAFSIGQPEEVDVNEILFRPTRQEL